MNEDGISLFENGYFPAIAMLVFRECIAASSLSCGHPHFGLPFFFPQDGMALWVDRVAWRFGNRSLHETNCLVAEFQSHFNLPIPIFLAAHVGPGL